MIVYNYIKENPMTITKVLNVSHENGATRISDKPDRRRT
jgi:hypothetical protein